MLKEAQNGPDKFRFGDFELDAKKRTLRQSGRPVAMNPRAFALLLELIENRGRVITKDDLLARVWEGQFVEENNLTVQISALRKAFGEKKGENTFIATVPGKGYSFVADVVVPAEDNEIVIEKHEFSRIVVEETLELAEDGNGSVDVSVRELKVSAGRSSVRLSAVAVAAVVLLAVFSGAFMFRDRLFSNRGEAAFVQHTVSQLTANGKVGNAALSGDGKLFVYTINDLGNQSLWLGYVDGGGDHLQLREASETSYRSLAFSHDASTIYFSAVDEKNPKGAVFRIPVSGGVQTKLIEDVRDFSLSPDGLQIIFEKRDNENNVHVFYAADVKNTADPREIGRLPAGYIYYRGSGSISPDGGSIAMSIAKPGSRAYISIGILDLGSNRLIEISPSNAREITKTRWLADGRSLIVTAVGNLDFSSVPQYRLWNVDLDTGDFKLVTADRSNYGESWHNDSGVSLNVSQNTDLLLAVEHRHATNVWVAPSDNLSAARQITNGSFGKYDGLWGLDWTPDGRLIYTTSDTQSQYLATMEADGSKQKSLTEPGKIDSQLTVSVDGKHIIFHSSRTSDLDVWRTDIDGSNPKQLTFGGFGYHPAPSADGRWVYFKSYHRGLGELCRVPIDGGERECLTENEVVYPIFSPDGNYFAAGLRTDKMRLAVFSAETNQVVSQFDLPRTSTLYMGFRWSPDGRSIAFRDKDRGYWMQPIDGGDARRIEGLPDEKLFNFAWSKDGSQFAFVRGQEIRDVVIFKTATN